MSTKEQSTFNELSAETLGGLHDEALRAWYQNSPDAIEPGPDIASIILAQHYCNFRLWGLEDEARRDDVDDAYITGIKRGIDKWNQRRNDLVEEIDRLILTAFEEVDVSQAALHSETAGMIVDRSSILALKIRNMGVYAAEKDDADLARECLQKQEVLKVQRSDLLSCLGFLMQEFRDGTRCFKSYKQFKAYNDPRLNPAVRK